VIRFEDVSVTFTPEVTDGIHGAIGKALKPIDPASSGIPVVQPAASGGCCLRGAYPRGPLCARCPG